MIVQTINAQWIDVLHPSVFAQLLARAMNFPTHGALLNIPERATTPKLNGSFLAEGQAIPVKRFGLAAATPLRTFKLGVLSEFTSELRKRSQPAIETVLKSVITEDTAAVIDAALLDDAAASTNRPAGLRFNAVVVTPAAAGPGAMASDIRALVSAIQPSANFVLIANPVQAADITLASGSSASALPVISAVNVAVGTVLIVDVDGVVFASEAMPVFDISEYSTVHEDDATPLPIATPGSPPTIAAPVRSLWQTECIGLRCFWDIGWNKRRAEAVAVATGVTW